MIRVLCIDDHALVRYGIELTLSRQKDMELIGSLATGEEAIEFFRHDLPDVTLVDLELATMDGADTIRTIRAIHPNARFIVLTVYEDEEHIHRAMSAGASTYLLKETLSAELVQVIRQVHSGECPVSESVEAALHNRAAHPTLTAREVEIMQHVVEGKRNKEIAAALFVSEVTVMTHLRNIYAKLGVNDRTAALSVAVRRGIVQIR